LFPKIAFTVDHPVQSGAVPIRRKDGSEHVREIHTGQSKSLRAGTNGFFAHLGFGWIFSLLYVLVFQSIGVAGWWRGMLIGLVHAFFVLVVVMSLLPGVHPRMASEQYGPEAHNMLEPPGFLALHYGMRTPISIILSHAIFGTILGAFYQLK
jgi:hypothetical protein